MLALILSLALLAVGYAFLMKGPTLLNSTIMGAICRRLVEDGRRVDATIEAHAVPNLDRFRHGDAWADVGSEQGLLDRALDIAIRRTEIGNQYPRTMARALAA